jgi:hypothetical protein
MNTRKPPSISFFALMIALATGGLIFCAVDYPLLGSLGAESGILFGAVIGPLLFLSGAIRGAYCDERGFKGDLVHEMTIAFGAALMFACALLINGIFVASCAPARGVVPFAVHAIPVMAFDLVCGLLIGRLVRNRAAAVLVAILVAGVYAFVRVLLWWQSPSFRFLSHPFIVIDGDLARGAGLSPEVVGFRLATALFALALILIGLLFFSSAQRTPFKQEKSSPFALLFPVFALTLLGGCLHVVITNALEPSISERLQTMSRESRRGPFVVHSDPRKTTADDANAILAEATLWQARLKAKLGELSGSEINIWLYSDFASLKRFTGASHVHFALPSQREIHVVGSEVPHPTLGHELAHVLVGEKVSTYTGLPGVWGFLPSQGITEGLAVMLTPELAIRADLTLEEQSAALAQSGKLPDLQDLFSVSPLAFFASNPAMAYSVAGAYLEELVRREPDSKSKALLIARLASEGDLDAVFTSPEARASFEQSFVQKLKTQTLPPDAKPSVLSIFGKPAVLSETCEDIDNESSDLVTEPLMLAQRTQKEAEKTGPNLLSQKQVLLDDAADFYWRANQQKQALDLWRQIQIEILPPSEQRTHEAKAILAGNPNSTLARRALDYLVSTRETGRKTNAASMILGAELQKRDFEAIDANPSQIELIANYLMLRAKVVANGNAQDVALLERMSSNRTLPSNFQIESMRLITTARALGPKAWLAADQYRQIATLSTRGSLTLQMLDSAERAELIAAALSLDESDPQKSDKWLLGTARFDQ